MALHCGSLFLELLVLLVDLHKTLEVRRLPGVVLFQMGGFALGGQRSQHLDGVGAGRGARDLDMGMTVGHRGGKVGRGLAFPGAGGVSISPSGVTARGGGL